ncbi:hypothetical protein MBAV_004044, partial [Candidatus Magnetobacterium bavaricum]
QEQPGQSGKDKDQRPDNAPRDNAVGDKNPRRPAQSMTKEEAEMLLEGLRYEQSGDVLKNKEPQKPHTPVLKDW